MARDEKLSSGRSDRIEWVTVRYRTLAIAGAGLIALAAVGWFVLRPKPPQEPPPVREVETGARFGPFEGTVEVKRAGTLEWVPATKSTVLRQNDLVRTRSGGVAEIVFSDGTNFAVRPDSLITIEESTQNPVSRQQKIALSLQSGEANFTTAARAVPGSTTISTPTLRTTVDRESAGSMQVDQSGATGMRLFRGKSQVETKSGQRIALASNEGLKVDAAGGAGAKTALPLVPQLTAPSNQAEISLPDLAQGITLLLWSSVPGASGYRVLVDYGPSFARPLYDRRNQRTTQMELHRLEAGSYYWKVAAVDAGGAEGGFSELWRFSLAKAAQSAAPPPIAVETLELKGNVLHARGRTEPGATLLLNGDPVDVQPDGSFNEFLAFDGSPSSIIVLRSTGAKGGVAEQRRLATVVN